MLLLFETPAGFALFKVLDEGKLSKVEDLGKEFSTPDTARKIVKLKAFSKFENTSEALEAATKIIDGSTTKSLRKFLSSNCNGESLAVADSKLGNSIKEKLKIDCVHNQAVMELMRGLRSQLTELISGLGAQDLSPMSLGLSHSLCRYKLKFSPDKVDTMIVQAIGLLDDLDKELNIYGMRVKEWYGWHFPEFARILQEAKINQDFVPYSKAVKRMGRRENSTKLDFSDILPEEVESKMKEASVISMGVEISDEDLDNLKELCDQVISLCEYRAQLHEYLKSRMNTIAPNLTALVGELVGARLISHGGSLMNLAKQPGSTVQILGAEKALFRALKTKHSTPKYGLIFHASLVGQASTHHKGKISRSLAAKAALAIRYDALGEGQDNTMGLEHRAKDCFVDICAPEVLSLFTDNFDYQHLRRHFVKGLLVDDIMGYKIFTHEINGPYAVRVDNYKSYDTVSRDIIQRWTYPFVPDVRFFDNCDAKLVREGMYKASELDQARSALIGPFTVIGRGTKIGESTSILSSVIGKGCRIGSNVSIMGSYIWDNVVIEDGCVIRHSIVSDGALLKAGAVLEPGVVLSFKVVVGEKFVVPAYSKVSLARQPTEEDSDEELEYAEENSGTLLSSITGVVEKTNGDFSLASIGSQLGPDGAGYVWSICEGTVQEEWRHSVAPIRADKIAEALKYDEDGAELLNVENAALSLSGDLNPGSVDGSEDDTDNLKDDFQYFDKEVEATFLRAVNENIQVPHVILEMNSLRLSYNMNSADCAGAIFYALMKVALESPRSSTGELVKNVSVLIDTWIKLLKFYAKEQDDQIEIILRFEEMCMESAKIFSSCFSQILSILYDKDILEEDAILRWADEKKDAEPSDKVFVMQCLKFIEWLKNAEEEED